MPTCGPPAIATNLTRNHSHRGAAGAPCGLRETRSERDGVDPEGEARFSEARERLEAVVTGLPLKQRLAFVLRKVHDFDYDVIAESLHCSAESARAHVFQALKKIRLGLRDHELVAATAMTRKPDPHRHRAIWSPWGGCGAASPRGGPHEACSPCARD
jgi:hypothetical protein